MMADLDVLRAERKDKSGGKTMFGLFLFISVTINKHLMVYKLMNIRLGASLHYFCISFLNISQISLVRVLSELAFLCKNIAYNKQ